MTPLATATAHEVFALLHDDLAAIEREFEAASVSSVGTITEISSYLREGGGKRIRPSLLLLAAHAMGYEGSASLALGAVVEMIHTATLVHDDIIDDARTRRGRPSANTTFGNSRCVLTGDWLYMQAFRVALEQRNFHILDLLIGLTQKMVEGELLQMEKLGHLINEQEYFDLIYRKTACLFRVCMRLGATLALTNDNFALPAGMSSDEAETMLGDFGRHVGLAFQIVDDVLDLTADESVLGKPVASDLREGKATLAVIHALEQGTGAEREKIRMVLADRSFARVSHAEILEIVERYGSIDYAMAAAITYAESARACLEFLPSSDYKRALVFLADFVVARDR